MKKHRSRGAGLVLVALAVSAAGCAPIPAGGGRPAGIYFSGQRAAGVVRADLPVVAAHTRAVLADMGVTVVAREARPDDPDLEIRGSGPEGRVVRVELEDDADGNTRVRASVRKNAVEWDREYARAIVERIARRS